MTGPKYDQAIAALIDRLNTAQYAEQLDQEASFRALFTPAEQPSLRERLAELEAVSDRIEPLLDRLDTTWRAVETGLGWHGRRRTVP